MTPIVTESAKDPVSDPDPIPVRRMDFEFTDDIPEHWATENNALLTALMSALSASFPAGERYFIDSVRHYADRIEDPALKERVKGFVGQEANHTKEHLAFNRFLEKRGMPVLPIERRVEELLRRMRTRNTPAESLAHTVALEHLTAFLASAALASPEFFDSMHPTIAAFWGWHLIEELEHRAVAFDVYQRCVGDEGLRVRAMALTTAAFTLVNAVRTARLIRRTRAFKASDVVRGISLLFGRRGFLTKVMPLYRAFYRRDFHPEQHDVRRELDRARGVYLTGRVRAPAPA